MASCNAVPHDGEAFQTACPHPLSLIKWLQLADREMQDPYSVGLGGTMLTKDILFGMNIITLAGFVVMGLSLSLSRAGQIGAPLSVGLMCAGTALVFFGLFAGSEPR